ncbi:DNA repair and recombination protein RadB [Candidatus Woesearchaeota archaeon]|nr:DNA repair and recombination protein RadB [Candidatus Woesearchaeota archaeon]
METKESSGCAVMDWLLEGGYEKGVITTIYGPGGSGKSNLLVIFIANSLKGQKVIYVDTEGSFSLSRFMQVCGKDYKKTLEKITFLKPTNFKEQEAAIRKLEGLVKQNIGAIIVDSLTMLYRIEMDDEDSKTVNKSLVSQIRSLLEIARKNDIPVLVSSQVYADFEDKEKTNVVGGTIIKNMSKCLIELRKSGPNRVAIVQKHRSIEEGKAIMFKIVDEGVVEVEQEPSKSK